MSEIKINNKKYAIPELNFRHSKIMEQMGVPITGILDRHYFFSAISAFVAIVVGCEPEQADYLVEQHVLGGGSIYEIYEAYAKAMNESDFFKKLVQMSEAKKPKSIAQTEQPLLAEIVEK